MSKDQVEQVVANLVVEGYIVEDILADLEGFRKSTLDGPNSACSMADLNVSTDLVPENTWSGCPVLRRP